MEPAKYYEACVSDACACDSGGDCECFCTAVAAYAQACRDVGVCVSWRTPDVCRESGSVRGAAARVGAAGAAGPQRALGPPRARAHAQQTRSARTSVKTSTRGAAKRGDPGDDGCPNPRLRNEPAARGAAPQLPPPRREPALPGVPRGRGVGRRPQPLSSALSPVLRLLQPSRGV